MARSPVRRSKSSDNPLEKQEGMAITSWVKSHYPNVLFAHVANEGQERKIAEGLVPGYPDYTLDEARGGYFGLRIELKRRKGGSLSDNQRQVAVKLLNNGYVWVVCRGFPEAKMIIQWYMSLSRTGVDESSLPVIPVTSMNF